MERSGKRSLRKVAQEQNLEDSFEDIDEVIEGKRTYDVEDKLTGSLYNESYVEECSGKDVNFEMFQRQGFDHPLFVKCKDGLGLEVPSDSFTARNVMEHVGAECQIEVINTETQSSESWSMEKWVTYYETSTLMRKRVWNVISLEFTGTTLDPLVQSPEVVRETDWAQKAWPLDLMYVDIDEMGSQDELTFPKVLKYCLMSVVGCYTDFHIDLGGTSVWYHIIRGKKVFWLVPPTVENLQAYEKWSTSGEQERSFLADKCVGCQRITISAGNTLFIPTGWIHAVYTPEDSLVFGGNFLHSYNVGLQLRVVAIEEKLRIGLKYRYPFFHEMMWYIYDHYNIALTGTSYMLTSDGEPVSNMCEIVDPTPVLSKYELQGLRNLREWLPNQDTDTFPDTDVPNGREQLLDSMLVAIAKHAGDEEKTPCPAARSVLQWKETILKSYQDKRLKELDRKENVAREPKVTTRKKKTSDGPGPGRPRRAKCGKCTACLQTYDCRKCNYCKDMKKYGGPGRLKQTCSERRCVMFTADSFKAIARLDPKQIKIDSAFTKKSKTEKKAGSGHVDSPKKVKVKDEPKSPVKDVLETPAKRAKAGGSSKSPPTAEPSTAEKECRTQLTLTQYVRKTEAKKKEGKLLKSDMPTSANRIDTIEGFGEGTDMSAEEFGHSQGHLESLLNSASSNRLNVNGNVMFYRQKAGEEVRVFIKKGKTDLDSDIDDVKSAVLDGAVAPELHSMKSSVSTSANIPKKRQKLSGSKKDDAIKRTGKRKLLDLEARSAKRKKASKYQNKRQYPKPKSLAVEQKATDDEEELEKHEDEKGFRKVVTDEKPKDGNTDAPASGGKMPSADRSGSENLDAPNLIIEGAALVKNVEGFLSAKVKEAKLIGFPSEVKMVFLCLSQAMDEDTAVVYMGHVMAVVKECYLYRISQKHSCKQVKIELADICISLPLVFPKPADLISCQKIAAKPFMVEEDESASNAPLHKAPDTKQVTNEGITAQSKLNSSKPDATKQEPASDEEIQEADKKSEATDKCQSELSNTTSDKEHVQSDTPESLPTNSEDNQQSDYILAKSADNVIHRIGVKSVGRMLTTEEVMECVRKAGYTPLVAPVDTPDITSSSHNTKPISQTAAAVPETTRSDEVDKGSPIHTDSTRSLSPSLKDDGESDSSDSDIFDSIDFEVRKRKIPTSATPRLLPKPLFDSTKVPISIVRNQSDILEFSSKPENTAKKNKLSSRFETLENRILPATSNVSTKVGKRRSQCGFCDNCQRPNCRKCVFCRDMKKYGGPARLKQRCIETRCINMSKKAKPKAMTSKESDDELDTQNTLDRHFKVSYSKEVDKSDIVVSLERIDESSNEKPVSFICSTIGEKDESSEFADTQSKSKAKGKKEKSSPTSKPNYHSVIKAEASKVRKMPNCGECVMCLDKLEFGGKNKKKQMCLVKKEELQQRLAKLEQEEKGDDDSDSSPEKLKSRTSSRRRKLTQKMEESMDQEWNESVSMNMLQLSDYASSLLDNYLESLHVEGEESADVSCDEYDSDATGEDTTIIEEVEDRELNELLMSELMDEMDGNRKNVSMTETSKSGTLEGGLEDNPQLETSADSELPLYEDVLVPVFKYLPRSDLLNCARVCQAWYIAHRHPSLWKLIDLTKRAIDESVAESVVALQPETLTLNKSITSTEALSILLSGLTLCSELSMKGVTALTKLGLNYIPLSVENLNISSIPSLTDTAFASMFSRESIVVYSPDYLTNLDISNTEIGDQTLRLIARYLSQLCSLNVNACNNITNAGFISLNSTKRTVLSEIEINDCEGLDSECLKALDSDKCRLSELRSVNFNGCPNISLMDIKNFVNAERVKEIIWTFSRRHLQRNP